MALPEDGGETREPARGPTRSLKHPHRPTFRGVRPPADDEDSRRAFVSRARLLVSLFISAPGLEIVLVALALPLSGCREKAAHGPDSAAKAESSVSVTVSPGGPVVFKTPTAEFDLLDSGYLEGFLAADGQRLTLDEPGAEGAAESVEVNGKPAGRFELDFNHVKISEASGAFGRFGKRVEVSGVSSGKGAEPIEKKVTVEVYADFPNLAVMSEAYRNTGSKPVALGLVRFQEHRLNASLVDPQVPPFRMWSFQGSSIAWGKDDVLEIPASFSQSNFFGPPGKEGIGGGVPVVAFWTRAVGEAVGHLEPLPLELSIPVKVGEHGRVGVSLAMDAAAELAPDESFRTPRSFLSVYHGDYFEPLRIYSQALERQGRAAAKPGGQDYEISWCGWGYESEVTPAQMLGTIPKLKEFGIHWATLDDRWFDDYGDWNPRPDTFPGDAVQKMVKSFHQQGIRVQIWWLPLAVEDGEGRYESHPYALANVAKEHPDWLILTKDGRHARMARGLAALCPALPEVQDYYRSLTEKFIRDWDFDGHKLDNVYSVPPCYNPKHHHRSPDDSTNAMGEVYRVIFETTRQLKPESVTQICPCGTPPNIAWLPFLDQAVTADPVGSVQVRRRIKMYKALLGPQAAVYGDHVELTKIRFSAKIEHDIGSDFASTVGAGGVVGTKFVWPDPGPHFSEVLLTPAKEAVWKKWTSIYNSKKLARGEFLDLYTIGYDVPEGYAIAKDGRMYYAFFSPDSEKAWKGVVELRGLAAGRYHVLDYENGKDLGSVEGPDAKLSTEFAHHLLLEVSPE
jgi:alpha-galactosidase